MENKKYELTNITMEYNGRVLHRIRALKTFNNVKKGDLGGWIGKESNLSHEGECWIYDEAKVYDNARIFGNAMVFGYAEVYGSARVYGDAEVFDNALVYGDARVYGDTHISNDVIISSKDDYITITGLGSNNRNTTFFKCKDNIIRVHCGCFNGTLEEFIDKVNITHKDNDKYREEYLLQVEVIKRHFNVDDTESIHSIKPCDTNTHHNDTNNEIAIYDEQKSLKESHIVILPLDTDAVSIDVTCNDNKIALIAYRTKKSFRIIMDNKVYKKKDFKKYIFSLDIDTNSKAKYIQLLEFIKGYFKINGYLM